MYVARLEIPVRDSAGVSRGESVGDLDRDLQQTLDWHAAGTNQIDEALPFHELHAQQELVGILLDTVDDCDVRMVERGQDPRLSPKAFAPSGAVREPVSDDFQGDQSIQARIARPIHLAHAPGSQLAEDLVATELCACLLRHSCVSILLMGLAASIAHRTQPDAVGAGRVDDISSPRPGPRYIPS